MTRRDLLKGLFATAVYTVASPVLPNTVGERYAVAPFSLDLIETTLMQYRRVLVDNITSKNAFWMFLREKGYVNEFSA